MNFEYSSEESARVEAFRSALAGDEIASKGEALQGEDAAPEVRNRLRRELMAFLGERGYLGLEVPKAEGGQGLPALAALPWHEALAGADPSLFAVAEASSTVAWLLARAGSPEQKARFLQGLLAGTTLASPVLSSPLARDPAGVALPAPSGWTLSGVAAPVVNVADVDLYVVSALARGDGDERVPALFLVSRDTQPGEAEAWQTPGLKGAGLGRLGLGAALPPDARLDGSADVPALLRRTTEVRCLRWAAFALGVSRELVERSLTYANEVQVDGRALFKNQEYSFKIAEMYALTDTGEQLCRHAAWQHDTGDARAATTVRAAKLFCGETASRSAHLAAQIRGAHGYRIDPVQRLCRDARFAELAVVSSEVLRGEIAADVLKGV